MPQELGLNWSDNLSLLSLFINLGLGAVLSLILRWHYKRFSSTLSGRDDLAHVFPLILLTTVLIITVVKSSLALSLGLVGALSIVRFRTPIKEPEELAYLFITIAMGLGLGADQTMPTVLAGLTILIIMAFLKWKQTEVQDKNLFLSIDWPQKKEDDAKKVLECLNKIITMHVKGCDLRRFDARPGLVEVMYYIDVGGTDSIDAITSGLKESFPGIGVSFIDQNQLPTL